MSYKHEVLVDLLHDVQRKLAEQMRVVCQEHGIPPAFVVIGGALRGEPGITVSELARRTGMAKSHVSNTIEELARRGWVDKHTDPADQRLLRLHLTPSATDRWQQVRASMRGLLAELVAEIPEGQTAALVDGLQVLKALLERTKERGRAE